MFHKIALFALFAAAASASPVRVTVTGTVASNDFNGASQTFHDVPVGAPVRMRIHLDSALSADGELPSHTRGYQINAGKLELDCGGIVALSHADESCNFVVRNDDPREDGFFLSTGTDEAAQVRLDAVPSAIGVVFSRTFDSVPADPSNDPDPTLSSLDIMPGSWGGENLAAYTFQVQRNDSNVPMEIDLISLSIVAACGPADVGSQGGVAEFDGLLDNCDMVVFIDLFFHQDPAADLGQTGGVPGADGAFDNNDFVVLIDYFFAGC